MIQLVIVVCMLNAHEDICHTVPMTASHRQFMTVKDCQQEAQSRIMQMSRDLFFAGQPHRIAFACEAEGEAA